MTQVNNEQEARVVPPSKNITLKIAGAAIFGALSIIVSLLTTENLPRMPWGIAYFDPVSIIWLLAFLIFGVEAGILTCIIGMVGLMPFDPTPFVGPVMKFVATIWHVLIPYLVIRMKNQKVFSGEVFSLKGNYALSSIGAWIIRCVVMIFLNAFYIQYVWHAPVQFLDLSWMGISGVNGWIAVAITVFLLNTIQAFFDATLPYFLVFKTKIYNLFNFY